MVHAHRDACVGESSYVRRAPQTIAGKGDAAGSGVKRSMGVDEIAVEGDVAGSGDEVMSTTSWFKALEETWGGFEVRVRG